MNRKRKKKKGEKGSHRFLKVERKDFPDISRFSKISEKKKSNGKAGGREREKKEGKEKKEEEGARQRLTRQVSNEASREKSLTTTTKRFSKQTVFLFVETFD